MDYLTTKVAVVAYETYTYAWDLENIFICVLNLLLVSVTLKFQLLYIVLETQHYP